MFQITDTVFLEAIEVVHNENYKGAGNGCIEIPGRGKKSRNQSENVRKKDEEKSRPKKGKIVPSLFT